MKIKPDPNANVHLAKCPDCKEELENVDLTVPAIIMANGNVYIDLDGLITAHCSGCEEDVTDLVDDAPEIYYTAGGATGLLRGAQS